MAFLAFLSMTLLVAYTVTGWLCRRKYRPLHFMLWLALWTILGSLVTTYAFYIVGSLILSSGLSGADILQALLMLSLVGLIFGLCLYILNLPFMILGFKSAFFRQRFVACLHLEPAPATLPAA